MVVTPVGTVFDGMRGAAVTAAVRRDVEAGIAFTEKYVAGRRKRRTLALVVIMMVVLDRFVSALVHQTCDTERKHDGA